MNWKKKLRNDWGRLDLTSKVLTDFTIGAGSYGIAASAVDKNELLPTYLRITDIYDDGTLNFEGLKSVDDPKSDNYKLEPNDMVFARTGGSTGRNYFYDGEDGEFIFAGFLIKFSIDPEKCNPKFIKYYCQSQEYKEWVQSFNTGSTRGNINAKTFGNMPIPYVSRKQQDLIVKTLSALDDKIAENKKINHHLAEIAKSIFDSYFIDLSPYNGVMPDDWQLSNLTGIANYLNGLAMQKHRPQSNEQGLPVLKIKELRQGFTDSTSDLCSSNIRRDYIIHDRDVIFSWSGSLLVDFWTGGDCGLNQHLFKVSSETYDKWFYYAWTKHHLDRFVKMAADRATTMGHIKRDALEKAEVLIPSNKDYQEIGNKLKPIYDQIINNRVESRKLVALRDTLLPKLMSGEISVTD